MKPRLISNLGRRVINIWVCTFLANCRRTWLVMLA